jgi:hypothetical protein
MGVESYSTPTGSLDVTRAWSPHALHTPCDSSVTGACSARAPCWPTMRSLLVLVRPSACKHMDRFFLFYAGAHECIATCMGFVSTEFDTSLWCMHATISADSCIQESWRLNFFSSPSLTITTFSFPLWGLLPPLFPSVIDHLCNKPTVIAFCFSKYLTTVHESSILLVIWHMLLSSWSYGFGNHYCSVQYFFSS